MNNCSSTSTFIAVASAFVSLAKSVAIFITMQYLVNTQAALRRLGTGFANATTGGCRYYLSNIRVCQIFPHPECE